MEKVTKTCGIFIFNNKNQFLICHPTNAKHNGWSIPKGQIDADETELEAAIREVREEANIDITCVSEFTPLEPSRYPNKKKILYSFLALEADSDVSFETFDLKCNSFVLGKKGDFPEVDAYLWVTIAEAEKYLPKHQTKPLDEIKDLLKWINL